VVVVPDAQGFFLDNVTSGTTDFYRNKLTLWQGANPSNQKAMLLVSGFDAYNTLSAEYYREAFHFHIPVHLICDNAKLKES
jgi:hypothetical protein